MSYNHPVEIYHLAKPKQQEFSNSKLLGLTVDWVAVDLEIAVNASDEVVGKTATEDLRDVIFSQFCVGK